MMTADPLLRLVYVELLFALYEQGGSLPASPDDLQDVLGLPSEEIARCLPVLERFGRDGRGGVVIADGQVTNPRVTEELNTEREFREEQAEFGKASAEARRAKYGSARPVKVASGAPKVASRSTKVAPGSSEPASTSTSTNTKGKDTCGETACAAPPPAVVLEFPVKAGENEPHTWALRADKVAQWEGTYPEMNVMAELRRALQWVLDAGSRQKTARGMTKYLGDWLQRSQNNGTYVRRNGVRPQPIYGVRPLSLEQQRADQRLADANAARAEREARGESS